MSKQLTGVRITVIRGEVKNADTLGKSDPYAVLTVDGVKKQTGVIENCLKPEWNETLEFPISSAHPVLLIQAYDKDVGKTDDELGSGTLDLEKLITGADGVLRNIRVPLELKGKREGWIEISAVASWKMAQDVTASAAASKQLTSIILTVHSGKNLAKTDLLGKPDPYVVVRTLPGGHNDVFQTAVQKNCSEPVWQETHEFNVQGENEFKIEVYDKDMVGKELIGEIQVPFKELGLHRGAGNRWIPIFKKQKNAGEILIHYVPQPAHGAPETALSAAAAAAASLAAATPAKAGAASPPASSTPASPPHPPAGEKKDGFSYPDDGKHGSPSGSPKASPLQPGTQSTGPVGMKVTIVEGHALKGKDFVGSIDPYVETKAGGDSFKTKVVSSQAPVWGDYHYFDFKQNPAQDIKFEVKDKDRFGKDDLIGTANVPVASVPRSESRKLPLYKDAQMQGGIKVEFEVLYDRPGAGNLSAMTVGVKEAKDLPAETGFMGSKGKADPYVKVSTAKEQWQTTAKKDTSNPHWDESHTFGVTAQPALKFDVFDKDIGKDDLLCSATVPLSDIPVHGGPVYKWIPLQKKDGSNAGQLHICFSPKFSSPPALAQPPAVPPLSLPTNKAESPKHAQPAKPPAAPVAPVAPIVPAVPNTKHIQIEALRRQIEDQRRKNEELRRHHHLETTKLRNSLADQKDELRRSLSDIRHEVTRRDRLSQMSPPRSPTYLNYPQTYMPPPHFSSPPTSYSKAPSQLGVPTYFNAFPPQASLHSEVVLPPRTSVYDSTPIPPMQSEPYYVQESAYPYSSTTTTSYVPYDQISSVLPGHAEAGYLAPNYVPYRTASYY